MSTKQFSLLHAFSTAFVKLNIVNKQDDGCAIAIFATTSWQPHDWRHMHACPLTLVLSPRIQVERPEQVALPERPQSDRVDSFLLHRVAHTSFLKESFSDRLRFDDAA